MPSMGHNIRNKLDKLAGGNDSLRRRRQGTKAYEYNVDCLPDTAREAIQARMARQLLAQSASLPARATTAGELVTGAGGEKVQRELALYRKCPALLEKKLHGLTNSQKAVGDARMVLVQEVLRLMDSSENGGLSMKRKQAAEFIADASVAGTLPDYVQRAADIANARKGTTRVVVGWSLAMSESQVAVGDAIRNAVSRYGVPLMYYSDNGGGEKTAVFDADITGIFSRLGIEHPTGIPGNPQGRGIIERFNQEIPKRAAMAFGSWVGKSGDREAQRKYRKAVDSAVNALEKGKPLNEVQTTAMRKVPTMQELVAEIESQVERHNNRPHCSLPERENGQHWSPLAWRNHVIKQEQEEIQFLTSSELHEMFRPEQICTARRGEIQLFKNIYFSTELACVEGEEVRVCFDIHDPHSVIVRRMDGSWICDAIWNGNKVDAFPKARIEQLKEKRVKRSVRNLEDKVRRKQEELRPALEQRPEIDVTMFAPVRGNNEPEKVYLFESEFESDLKKASNHQ
ncbi:phage transposase [Erwinia tracheiphila PSU-1]|nr:phage transposase [Erwinia tracheiphila PSU-1]